MMTHMVSEQVNPSFSLSKFFFLEGEPAKKPQKEKLRDMYRVVP